MKKDCRRISGHCFPGSLLICDKCPDNIDWEKIENQLNEVRSELIRATSKFGSFNSPHEGYALIKEELEELWDEIKKNSPSKWKMQREAIQLCAMTLRFLHDSVPFLLGPDVETLYSETSSNCAKSGETKNDS